MSTFALMHDAMIFLPYFIPCNFKSPVLSFTEGGVMPEFIANLITGVLWLICLAVMILVTLAVLGFLKIGITALLH
jgi:hypothetical protein